MVYHSPKSIAKLSYFVVRNMVAGKQDGWTHNRWPGPWYKGLPREPDIRTIKLNSDVLSPLYTSCFDHTYHSAMLLMPKSAAHSYKRHKPPNQPYTSARAASPRHHTPPPFLLSFIHRAQLPRQQEPGSYPTPAIRPDEEDNGQLWTENSASKSVEPHKWPELLCVLFVFTNCFAPFVAPRQLGNPTQYLLLAHPEAIPRTPLWKPCPGALPHLPVSQEISKIRALVRTVKGQLCLGGFCERVESRACFFYVLSFAFPSFQLLLVHGGWVYWRWAPDGCVGFFSFRMFY